MVPWPEPAKLPVKHLKVAGKGEGEGDLVRVTGGDGVEEGEAPGVGVGDRGEAQRTQEIFLMKGVGIPASDI